MAQKKEILAPDLVTVLLLNPCSGLSYFEGDIFPLPKEKALSLQAEGKAKILTPEEADKITKERSEPQKADTRKMVTVRWINVPSGWSYFSGQIGEIPEESISTLLEEGSIEVLTETDLINLSKKRDIPVDNRTIQVKFVASHPEYSYFPGDICLLSPDQAKKLIDEGYVTLIDGGHGMGKASSRNFFKKHFKN